MLDEIRHLLFQLWHSALLALLWCMCAPRIIDVCVYLHIYYMSVVLLIFIVMTWGINCFVMIIFFVQHLLMSMYNKSHISAGHAERWSLCCNFVCWVCYWWSCNNNCSICLRWCMDKHALAHCELSFVHAHWMMCRSLRKKLHKLLYHCFDRFN